MVAPSSPGAGWPAPGATWTNCRRLTETSTRRLPDGRVTPHYDPAMVQQFISHPDAINIPVLCLRGENSDLVLRETTAEVLCRGPGRQGLAQVVEIAGCGHAPALNVPEQLDRVTRFIRSTD